jgi:inositol transport system permease protein
MVLSGVNSYLQEMVRGGIITLAVAYDIFAKTRKTKKKLGSLSA